MGLDAGSGQSVVFGDSNGATTWWILQGLQAVPGDNVFSTTTELWGNDPPSQLTSPVITLPDNLNLDCVVKISDYEALVVGRPETITDFSYSWKFNFTANTWTILQGVTLPKPIDSGSMVTVNNSKEVLYIGGWDGSNDQSGIWRMDGDMSSWTFAGDLTTARSNTGSLLVPSSSLPPLCATTPSTATTITTSTAQSQTTTTTQSQTTTITQSQTTTTTQSQTTTTTQSQTTTT